MKHLSAILLSAIVMAFVGCNKDFEVTSLVLHPSSVETTPLDTIQISFAMEYSGGNFKDPNLIQPMWESSNNEVVKVDSMGKIYTIAPGSADVTMSCGGASAICKVTVVSQNQPR
ncbi:MAG: Ig domain-containing protein [Muribaculaceae bacterium]